VERREAVPTTISLGTKTALADWQANLAKARKIAASIMESAAVATELSTFDPRYKMSSNNWKKKLMDYGLPRCFSKDHNAETCNSENNAWHQSGPDPAFTTY
jgi:hypothetical protein